MLRTVPATTRPDLLAGPVTAALAHWSAADEVGVAEIDPELADTAAFCARYDVPLAASANCVVVSGKRGGRTRTAACLLLATDRADVNNVVRRHLDVRKLFFAAQDEATAATGMEYGGITPIGLPSDWPILVDRRVTEAGDVVIGSGVRRSKLVVPGARLADLPGAVVLELAVATTNAPDAFNALPDEAARSALARCLAVPRWVEEMLAGRPYPTSDSALGRATRLAATLTAAEVEAALSGHPRIGERAGSGHDAEFSHREQSGVATTEQAALAAGNVAYEQRFDRIFLIRAAGRSGAEILAALDRRLANSDEDERAEVVGQLGEIAVLRLREVLA